MFTSRDPETVLDLTVGRQQQECGIAQTAEDRPDTGGIQSADQKDNRHFGPALVTVHSWRTSVLRDIDHGSGPPCGKWS
jgi:hypothetical protein